MNSSISRLLGRPDSYVLNAATNGRHGIANIDGEEWKEQRRFSSTVLKDLGFGKPFMEQKIRQQIAVLFSHLDKEIQETADTIDIVRLIKVSRWFNFSNIPATIEVDITVLCGKCDQLNSNWSNC